MTEATKLRKGDRVQLAGTVVKLLPDGDVLANMDGTPATAWWNIESDVIAKSTVLPRELKVGDWVTVNGASAPIMLINGDEAVLRHDDEDGSSHLTVWHLPDLSFDPDHKDDGE